MGKFATFTAVTAAALVGYAIYFDYNRRNSTDFRKSLKKNAAKHQKKAAKQEEDSKKSKINAVKQALAADLEANPIPTELNKKEEFFMQQVSLGEQLSVQASKKVDAAICFYKALAVYPNPTDILGIYQNTVPEDVYELVVMMIAVQPPAAVTNILGGGASQPQPAAKPTEADLD